MIAYKKGSGWLFALVGGPWGARKHTRPDGEVVKVSAVTVRLGWNRERTVEAALAELPADVTLGDARYVQRPALFLSGKRKGEQKTARAENNDWPAVEYAYAEVAA